MIRIAHFRGESACVSMKYSSEVGNGDIDVGDMKRGRMRLN